jgi:DNA repair protein RecO (recombination protein O)
MLVKDTAICIRAVDYSETSQIVTFFTRAAGKIGAIAKGSKRPKSKFDGPIEMFAYGNIVFSDSNKEKLATLTEFEQQPGPTHPVNNLFTLNCCLFAAELLNNLTNDYDPHPQLFDSLLRFLKNTRDTSYRSRDTTSLLILFQLALLKEVGLMPIWDYCVNCKTRYGQLRRTPGSGATSNEFYFSNSASGLVCRDCQSNFPDRIRLTGNAVDCLCDLKLIANANEKTLNEIEKILISYFTDILNRPPKMAKYILKM